MVWYAAHAIQAFERLDGEQDAFPVYENVILIEAESVEQAFEKAEAFACDDEGDFASEGLTIDDRPARRKFVGIRKLIAIQNVYGEDRPVNGAEITYSKLTVFGHDELKRLVEGKDVMLRYDE